MYYSLGDKIFRKENYLKSPSKYHISDAPKIYDVADIYNDFFGSKTQNIEKIPYDGQVHISEGNSYSRLGLNFLTRKDNNHFKIFLFDSLFKRNIQDANYVVDIMPKGSTSVEKNSIQTVPHIASAE